MAKRRVFRTRTKCPGISADLGPTSSQRLMIGRKVTLEKSSSNTEVDVIMDGAVVGQLDAAVGNPVALALERGQLFTAVIEKAFPMYNDKFKPAGAFMDIKVGYLLEKGQPAIEAPRCWRSVEASNAPPPTRSFFSKVAGVTFEGRQRIVTRCSEGERLILVRDPHDRHDEGAIKVMRLNGEQLGFIPSHVSRDGDSSDLAFRMDRGDQYRCRIKNITGGGPGESIGVNIEITDGEEFDSVSPSTPDARTLPTSVQPVLLWILALIIIGCILWTAFK